MPARPADAAGYRCLDPAAAVVQKALFGDSCDPDRLFRHCARIAAALARGEIALAQIYGLQIPLPDLDDDRRKRVARVAPFVKAGFNPDERPTVIKSLFGPPRPLSQSGGMPSGMRLRDAVRAHAPSIQRQIGSDLLRRCGVIP